MRSTGTAHFCWLATLSSVVAAAACGGATADSGREPLDEAAGGGAGSDESRAGGRGPLGMPGPMGGAGGLGDGGAGGILGDGGRVAAGGWATCFVAGTPIATPNGDVGIEALRAGDAVLAYDECSAEIVVRPVTALHVHASDRVGLLAVPGVTPIGVTDEHPVYDAKAGDYVPAGTLGDGARVLVLSAPRAVAGVSTAGFTALAMDGAVPVFNITVEGEHNYFAGGILVHNKGAGGAQCLPRAAPVEESEPCLPAACTYPSDAVDVVTLNAAAPVPPPIAGNGPDGGSADAGELARSYASAMVCASEAGAPPELTTLAFDTELTAEGAMLGVLTGDTACRGTEIGEVWFSDYDVPPMGEWTTQCVRVPSVSLGRSVGIVVRSGARVANLRAVSDCQCVRLLKRDTTCGFNDAFGYGGGSACVPSL